MLSCTDPDAGEDSFFSAGRQDYKYEEASEMCRAHRNSHAHPCKAQAKCVLDLLDEKGADKRLAEDLPRLFVRWVVAAGCMEVAAWCIALLCIAFVILD